MNGGVTFSGGINGIGGMTVTNGVSIANGLTVTGDAQISTDLTVTGNLYVSGMVFYGGGGGGSLSDQRLKKQIEPIPDALQKVTKLRGVYFHWNTTAMEARGLSPDAREQFRRQVGVIAQDVQAVLPELVRSHFKKTADGATSVNNSSRGHDDSLKKQNLGRDSLIDHQTERDAFSAEMETEDESPYLTVNYMYLAPVLIEAIHDLNANHFTMDKNIHNLQEKNVALQQRVTNLQRDKQQLERTVQALQQDVTKALNKMQNL
jgi:hypothetical protein